MVLPVFGYFFGEWLSKVWNGEYYDNRKKYMGDRYTTREVSDWVINHIGFSEGFRENAYYATTKELQNKQFTIGYGTSYLFNANGGRFVTNHPSAGGNGVRLGDTLTSLKKAMGYGHQTSKQFAAQLVKNYILADGLSGFSILFDLEKQGCPFNQELKDSILEFSYGSGSIHKATRGLHKGKYKNLNRVSEFEGLVNALKTRDTNLIASYYAYLRYRYYIINAKSQWNIAKWSWMARAYSAAMHIKGIEVSNPQKVLGYVGRNAKSQKNYEDAFKKDLNLTISMA